MTQPTASIEETSPPQMASSAASRPAKASTVARAKRAKPARIRRVGRLQSLSLLLVLLAAWEFGVRLFGVPKFLIPPISDIAVAMFRGLATSPWARDGFWYHTGVTLAEALLGFFAGSALGLGLALLISLMPRLEALINPYIAALQSLPKVAVAPIIVVWLGFGISSKVAIVAMLTFFPVLVTSLAGLRAADQDRIDLLRSLSATDWQIFRKAKFPGALPYVFAGLNMAAAFAIVGAIVGEFVGAQSGLGVLIMQMETQMDTAGSFAVFILLSVIGILMTEILRRIQDRVLHWMPADRSRKTVNV